MARLRNGDEAGRRTGRLLGIMAGRGRGAALAAIGLTLAAGASRAEPPWTTTPLSAPPLPADRDVASAWVSPDGTIAVYGVRHLAGGNDFVDLRCVRLDGETASVSLIAGIPSTDLGREVVFAPDSRRVAFTARVDVGAGLAEEVWSTPVCHPAATPVRLSPAGAPPPLARGRFLTFSPDSQRLLFASDHQEIEVFRVFSAPAGGAGPTVELGGAQPFEFNQLTRFVATPDGQRVVLPRRAANGVVDLVTVPAAGPAGDEVVLVHGTSAGVIYPFFLLTPPVGGRLVYAWNDESGGSQFEIFSVPLAGPPDQQVKLNPPLPAGRHVQPIHWLAPDGSRVAYLADPGVEGRLELFSVPIAGPAAASTRLNKPLPLGSTGLCLSPGLEPSFLADASRVVYSARQDAADRCDLYSVPAAGPGSSGVRLNAGDPQNGNYFRYFTDPQSSFVAWVGVETNVPGGLHLRRPNGADPQLDFCTSLPADEREAIAGAGGVFAVCFHGGGNRQLHHWRLPPGSPLTAVHTDVTPLDDGNSSPFELFGPSSATGGILFVLDHPTAGVAELFAADSRVFLSGFESGGTAAWSASSP